MADCSPNALVGAFNSVSWSVLMDMSMSVVAVSPGGLLLGSAMWGSAYSNKGAGLFVAYYSAINCGQCVKYWTMSVCPMSSHDGTPKPCR
jgi:hypothetical protein